MAEMRGSRCRPRRGAFSGAPSGGRSCVDQLAGVGLAASSQQPPGWGCCAVSNGLAGSGLDTVGKRGLATASSVAVMGASGRACCRGRRACCRAGGCLLRPAAVVRRAGGRAGGARRGRGQRGRGRGPGRGPRRRWVGGLAGRQAGGQAGRRAGRQAGRRAGGLVATQ